MENSKSNFAHIIRQVADAEHLHLTSYAYDWVFHLEDDAGRGYFLYGYKFPINNAAAASLCDDKAALSERLAACETPHVPHRFFMSPRDLHYVGAQGDQAAMCAQFAAWNSRAVVKPNTGTGGYLVTFVQSKKELLQAADQIFASFPSLALSPFVCIAQEYRVVMLDDQVQLVFEKQRPGVTGDGVHTIAQLASDLQLHLPHLEKNTVNFSRVPAKGEYVPLQWKHNLGQGAFARRVTDPALLTPLTRLSKRAMQNTDMRFASVDIVHMTDHTYAVLEINSGVMLEHFAAQSEENYRVARDIYRRVIRLLFDRNLVW